MRILTENSGLEIAGTWLTCLLIFSADFEWFLLIRYTYEDGSGHDFDAKEWSPKPVASPTDPAELAAPRGPAENRDEAPECMPDAGCGLKPQPKP